MGQRILWFPAIAILVLIGTASTAPAWARSGVTGFGTAASPLASPMHIPRASMWSSVVSPRADARHVDAQNGLRFDRRARLLNGSPTAIWPYSPYFDATPM